jgi:hypothetical protein
MKYGLILVLLLSLIIAARAQEPPPQIPETALHWGMTYTEARDIIPGAFKGVTIVRQQAFADMPERPVTGQYFFTPQQRLRYVQLTPAYEYQAHPDSWIDEYEHLTNYLTELYGEPVTIRDNRIIWQSADTQSQLVKSSVSIEDTSIPNGWIVRFDPIPAEEEEE